MQKTISSDNLLIYRYLSLGAMILIPLFWLVYKQSNPYAYDPIEFRLFFAALGLVIFIITFTNKNVQLCTWLMYGLYYSVLIWFMWILYKNHFTTNYFIGFVIILYAISLGFSHHRHLLYFFILQITLYASVSFASDYMEVNKFVALGATSSIFFLSYFVTYSKVKYQEEIRQKNHELEEKNKDILDSIHYAKRIQEAILPKNELIKSVFPDAFILYNPKDIVSGDFYWYAQKERTHLIAAADCTGHGVPGAFMSMIGSDQLNHIVLEKNLTEPGQILTALNQKVKAALKQTTEESSTRDGMDIALVSIEYKVQSTKDVIAEDSCTELKYAGANRPLILLRNNIKSVEEIEEIKADKIAIGGTTEEQHQFKTNNVKINKGDTVYLFSDGYVDQFGGPNGKKFMTKQFKNILYSIKEKNMQEQKSILNETMQNWMGTQQQVDDILVIGIRF